MMTINDFNYLLVEPSFFHLQIWDCATEEVVYDGMAEDVPDKYIDCEISSVDCPVSDEGNAYVCINIDTSLN